MLKKRIIPCLDIKDGRTVKGVNFINIIDAGDPIELAKAYVRQGADELVFLDITATLEGRKTFAKLVKEIGAKINIPFTVGGGISELKDVEIMLEAGADKITINSAAVKTPALINDIAKEFGSQCVVLAIDTNLINKQWKVFVHGGKKATNINTFDWARQAECNGAGEILLTSMANDGTKKGFANELTQEVSDLINLPVIASGGAGSLKHFEDIFTLGNADAALAASIFHFGEITIPDLKKHLRNKNIPVR